MTMDMRLGKMNQRGSVNNCTKTAFFPPICQLLSAGGITSSRARVSRGEWCPRSRHSTGGA